MEDLREFESHKEQTEKVQDFYTRPHPRDNSYSPQRQMMGPHRHLFQEDIGSSMEDVNMYARQMNQPIDIYVDVPTTSNTKKPVVLPNKLKQQQNSAQLE